MKKSIQLQFLATSLLLTLFQQNQYANDSDDDVNYENATIIYISNDNDNNDDNLITTSRLIGAAAGLTAAKFKLSGFSILGSMNLAASFVKKNKVNDIPNLSFLLQDHLKNLQPWYNNHLAKKYPEADFNSKKLSISYQAAANDKQIYIDYFNAITLNQIHEKQINGQKLTRQELNKMADIEWTMLHEATHINNYDLYTQNIVNFGTIAGLELAYQKYKRSQPITPPSNSWAQAAWKLTKSLPKRTAIFGAMATTTGVIRYSYSRYCETRADAFANEHADMNALKAASYYFKILSQSEDDKPSLFSSHPTLESRIQNIENEIKRRQER